MIHPWIFGGSLLAGGGLVAFALHTQPYDPSRLPSLEPSPTVINVVPPEPAPVVAEPASAVIEMPEVVVAAHARRAVKAPAPPAEPAQLRPCSSWRELGPTAVVSSTTSGSVSVRELCP